MAKRFDRLLEKATDSTLVEPNWDGILECVDTIRGREVPVKDALCSIRRRIHNENPHVALHALHVLEACVKNCGSKFHAEVATKEFMEDFKNLAVENTPETVKTKILELIQCWSMAFKDKPEYKIVIDTHNLMKLGGFEFPTISEADAMFAAESAPDWEEGDECFRCRTAFGILTRKHHCRACGQIFCDKCSGKTSTLPQYGIEKPVRVCDGCYDKLSNVSKTATSTQSSSIKPASQSITKAGDVQKTPEQIAKELKEAEEDELNLALAISQSEAEAKEQERQRKLYQLYNGPDTLVSDTSSVYSPSMNGITPTSNEPNIYKGAASTSGGIAESERSHEASIDPELAKYLDRDYWQQRRNEQNQASGGVTQSGTEPTAPPLNDPTRSHPMSDQNYRDGDQNMVPGSYIGKPTMSAVKQLDGAATPTPHFITSAEQEETAETMEFCSQLKEQVSIMENRIRSNAARGRSIVNDSAIQSLFVRLTDMHAQVMARMNKLDDMRTYFESLQDHLGNIQEARQAVTALRDDYERRKRERALEEQRLRQQMMQEKVDFMRQKKRELILQQRQMALYHFQQQEQEQQLRRMQQHMVYYQQQPQIQQGMSTVSSHTESYPTSQQPIPASYTQQHGTVPYSVQTVTPSSVMSYPCSQPQYVSGTGVATIADAASVSHYNAGVVKPSVTALSSQLPAEMNVGAVPYVEPNSTLQYSNPAVVGQQLPTLSIIPQNPNSPALNFGMAAVPTLSQTAVAVPEGAGQFSGEHVIIQGESSYHQIPPDLSNEVKEEQLISFDDPEPTYNPYSSTAVDGASAGSRVNVPIQGYQTQAQSSTNPVH